MPKKKKNEPTAPRRSTPIKPKGMNYATRSNAGDSVIGLLQGAGTAAALRKRGAPEERQIRALYDRLPVRKEGEEQNVNYTPDAETLSFLRSVGVTRGGDLCREYIKIEIWDVSDIAGYNVGVEKVFDYLITEARLQCFDERTKDLTATAFYIDFQDLVRRGIYNSIDNAKVYFKDVMRRLAKVGYSAKLIYSNASGRGLVLDSKLVPIFGLVDEDGVFRTYDLQKDNRAIIYINEFGPFTFFFEQLTLLPDYAGGLSEGAYKLVKEIFRRASLKTQRQHISAAGYFDIKLLDAAIAMDLPNSKQKKQKNPATAMDLPNKTKNPLRDSLRPILDAVKEINARETAKATDTGSDKLLLHLEVLENGGETTADKLKYGSLRARFSGDYRAYLSRRGAE